MVSVDDRKVIIKKIVDLYFANVHGRKASVSKSSKHDGGAGHWLEDQMGVAHNANNSPDLFGFEMKNGTKYKTTFGDWSASYYIFKSNSNKSSSISREDFLKIFGKPNPLKKNRYSWSGTPVPKISGYNSFGQLLRVESDNSIVALYSFSFDQRTNKTQIVPINLRGEEIVLAKWNSVDLRAFVEDKFCNLGWFVCKKNSNGVYVNICFGLPLTFELWISFVQQGVIYFDSGMYEGNSRLYSSWRANNTLWASLICETY